MTRKTENDNNFSFQVFSVSAFDPSEETSGVANVNTGLGYILGHDGAGTDYNLITNRDGKNGCISPDADAVAKCGRAPEITASRRISFNNEIVDEHSSVGDKTVVPDRYELANKGMRLDTASLPNLHSLLNFDERTDERVIIDVAPIEIDGLYNGNVLSEFDINNSDGAKLRLVHCVPLKR
jgi:hypothetical protein